MRCVLVVALVPAFNEERLVASVLVRLRECVDRVIVCDDGSVITNRSITRSDIYWLLMLFVI